MLIDALIELNPYLRHPNDDQVGLRNQKLQRVCPMMSIILLYLRVGESPEKALYQMMITHTNQLSQFKSKAMKLKTKIWRPLHLHGG
jgi:hypothetical protein